MSDVVSGEVALVSFFGYPGDDTHWIPEEVRRGVGRERH